MNANTSQLADLINDHEPLAERVRREFKIYPALMKCRCGLGALCQEDPGTYAVANFLCAHSNSAPEVQAFLTGQGYKLSLSTITNHREKHLRPYLELHPELRVNLMLLSTSQPDETDAETLARLTNISRLIDTQIEQRGDALIGALDPQQLLSLQVRIQGEISNIRQRNVNRELREKELESVRMKARHDLLDEIRDEIEHADPDLLPRLEIIAGGAAA